MATRERVGISPSVWVDTAVIEQLLAARRHEEALALCTGELLAGLDDDWVYEARDGHRDRMLAALTALAGHAERAGDLDHALVWTRRQLSTARDSHAPTHPLARGCR